jgi:ankyrin repeat protein
MNYENLVKALKENIKYNERKKLEKFCKDNNIKSEVFNNFNEILIYTIKSNAPLENIQFLLNERHDKNLNFFNNKNETPLLLAISENNFEIADLLIKNDADINYMAKNYETIEYLFKNRLLNIRNLRYVLNNGYNEKNITNNLIEKLIVTKNNEFLEMIFVHYNKFNNSFLIDRFLILYKNRIPLSSQELENILPKKSNKLIVTEAMYKMAYSCKNWEVFRILFENDGSEDITKMNRIIKYNLLEGSIKSNNYNFVKKVLRYVINFVDSIEISNDNMISQQKNGNSYHTNNNIKNASTIVRTIFCHGNNEMTNLENYPFLEAIKQNNIEIVKLLMDFAHQYDIIININDRDEWWGNYPLLEAIKQNNIEIVKLLVDYDAKMLSKLKIKVELKNYPLLEAIKYNNLDILQQLFRYASLHEIKLNIHESNALGHYPLQLAIQHNNEAMVKLLLEYADDHDSTINLDELILLAVEQNSVEMINQLMDYANDHDITIDINNKNKEGWENYSLLEATNKNNIDMVKLLMNYAKNHDILLKINEQSSQGEFALLNAIQHNNIEVVKLLLAYANDHRILVDINKKNHQGNYALLQSIKQNNKDLLQLLIDYSHLHSVVLNINDKYYDHHDECEYFPVLEAIKQNNIEIVKLLIEYSEERSIVLNMNEKTGLRHSPLLEAIDQSNTDMVQLILEYVKKHTIPLNINQYPWGNLLNPFYRATNKNNEKIINLLMNYVQSTNTDIDSEKTIKTMYELQQYY